MNHFSNLAKVNGVSAYRPFPAFQTVKRQAEDILKARNSAALDCAASYVLQSIEEFRIDDLAKQIEAHARHLSEHGGWELGYLGQYDCHPDDPDPVGATTDDIKYLLENWPSDAHDSPTYYEFDDVDALGEILCSGNIYHWDSIDGCKNATEGELYAVMTLMKLDDVAHAIFMSEQRTEAGIIIFRPESAMDVSKVICGANFLLEAMTSLCNAKREVAWASARKLRLEADGKAAAAWKLERAEIAKNERRSLATAGATARGKKYDDMRNAALQWYAAERLREGLNKSTDHAVTR